MKRVANKNIYRRNKLELLGYPDVKDLTNEDIEMLWKHECQNVYDVTGNTAVVTNKNKYEHLKCVQEPKVGLTIGDINLMSIKGHAPVTYRNGKPMPLPPGVSEEMAINLP